MDNEPKRGGTIVVERERMVDAAEYCELVVSRRPLQRIAGRLGGLHDAQSNEVFLPRAPLDLRVTERA